ncbi:MAG TPA: histidine phosphatase family protein [Acidimicrobiales bacterium]|jgi:probable phosphoglycerate mutase|nr:histidine phosphatase family protein [Acidimicrobiales bacterium]
MSTTDEAPAKTPATRKARPKAPAATLILFVRHGTTPTTGQVLPGRAPGLHLADKGRGEAEGVAGRLAALAAEGPPADATANGRGRPKGLRIAAVYASPMERARETAAPIATRLGLKVNIVKGLIEMDFGEWTGAELKALRKLPEWSAVQRYPSGFQFPGGESFSAMRGRMADTVAALCRRHPGEAIVAVAHADPIKVAVSDALGSHLDLFQRIVISTCSVTAISYSPTGPVVITVNSTGGLGDLRPS